MYAAVRFRARDDTEPEQVYGNRRLETGWTIATLVVLGVVLFFTIRTAIAADPNIPQQQQPDLVIIAHQWWWEAHYPQSGAVAANELHIPAGRRVLVQFESADVIHDFWVPQLGPKIDIIPGQPNSMWIEADTPGVYAGACAEFCGLEHAWMRIRVVAEPPSEFNTWLKHQLQPAPTAVNGAAAVGARIFQQQTCVSCHALGGSAAQANVGPDLTHIASRVTLGAGVMQNTPDNLARWLRDPQNIKPGIRMPNMRLSESDVQALVAYLETLQ